MVLFKHFYAKKVLWTLLKIILWSSFISVLAFIQSTEEGTMKAGLYASMITLAYALSASI